MDKPYHGYPNESLYHEAWFLAAEIEKTSKGRAANKRRLKEIEAQRNPAAGRVAGRYL